MSVVKEDGDLGVVEGMIPDAEFIEGAAVMAAGLAGIWILSLSTAEKEKLLAKFGRRLASKANTP